MPRNYAALPHEYLEEMALLSDEEFGRLCRGLLKYSAGQGEPALSGREELFLRRVVSQEDRFQASYLDLTEKRREAGKKGAAQRWGDREEDGKAIDAIGKDGNTETKTETKTKTETDPPGEGGKRRGRFVPPTVEEVREYVALRGSPVDPRGFVDHYEARGWMMGKVPMKDWKAACRSAEGWAQWRAPPGGGKAPAPRQEDRQGAAGKLRKDVEWLEDFLRTEGGAPPGSPPLGSPSGRAVAAGGGD